MKRALIAGMALAILAPLALGAGMLTRDYDVTVIGTATNSKEFVVRGYLEGIHIDAPAGATGTVSVATLGSTFFTAADAAADVVYFPVFPVHNSTGTVVSAEYTKWPLEGKTKVQVIGGSAGTNTWGIGLIFRP